MRTEPRYFRWQVIFPDAYRIPPLRVQYLQDIGPMMRMLYPNVSAMRAERIEPPVLIEERWPVQ